MKSITVPVIKILLLTHYPDGEDNKPVSLIPSEKFMELAACKADLMQEDWEGLLDIIVAALTTSNLEIMEETWRLTAEWQDWLEGLDWEDRLGRQNGRVWIPESNDLWTKVLGLYHDSPITGHLGTSRTLELVSQSYWWQDLQDWVKCYIQGCHTCRRTKH